jgi:hypothetical protein
MFGHAPASLVYRLALTPSGAPKGEGRARLRVGPASEADLSAGMVASPARESQTNHKPGFLKKPGL